MSAARLSARRSARRIASLRAALRRDAARRRRLGARRAALAGGLSLLAAAALIPRPRPAPREPRAVHRPPGPATRLQDLGARLLLDAGRPMTRAELNSVWIHCMKVDGTELHRCLDGRPLELLAGASIQSHPEFRGEAGPVPDRPGTTWDQIIGIASADRTIVLANWNLREHRTGQSVLLHEVGHQFDRRRGWVSDSPEWRALHRRARWNRDDAARFPDEGFADAFSDYHFSARTRARLPVKIRKFVERYLEWVPVPDASGSDARVLYCVKGPSGRTHTPEVSRDE